MHTSTSTPAPVRRALTLETINPAVLDVQYAVRGELALKADKYAQQLAAAATPMGEGSGTSKPAPAPAAPKLPFDKVVTANIGNPQQRGLDQQPITFWRQVIALLEYPALLDAPEAQALFPPDAIERARTLRAEIGSTGAYTHSKGVLGIRRKVAKFIEERDGHPSDPESIFLTAGASAGVAQILGLALRHGDGCLIPIPQYPLYTATLAYVGALPVPYFLQEQSAWSMTESDLERAIEAAPTGQPIKALVIINPGNPTGGCLTRDAIESVIRLCAARGILLLADEVYQNNIFDPEHKPFISFKHVLRSLEPEVANAVELVSFHSISKGVSGECGRRGGYFELTNIAPDVAEQIYKMASVSLCPPVSGQVGVDLLVDPPRPGQPSYAQWEKETSTTHNNLKSRSKFMYERFNALDGMSCQPAEGAMYLFPRIDMPARAVEEAKRIGKPADVMYALELLDKTGICAVAGSGFGQEPGTYHLRVTALCPGVEAYVAKIEQFHRDFMAQWA
ncbi:alanine transaminase [Cryptotrichosporon argae]